MVSSTKSSKDSISTELQQAIDSFVDESGVFWVQVKEGRIHWMTHAIVDVSHVKALIDKLYDENCPCSGRELHINSGVHGEPMGNLKNV